MKVYSLYVILLLMTACSEKKESMQSDLESKDSVQTESKKSKYTLIRDNLYYDKEGALYIRSQNKENIREGIKYDVWLKTVYCDTCFIPTEHGWKDLYELKDFVDTATFHLETTDNKRGAHIYRDKKYRYVHNWMADGGGISLEK